MPTTTALIHSSDTSQGCGPPPLPSPTLSALGQRGNERGTHALVEGRRTGERMRIPKYPPTDPCVCGTVTGLRSLSYKTKYRSPSLLLKTRQ